MSMLALISELGSAAAAALRERFPDAQGAIPSSLAVQGASRPEFGDLQISGCLQLAKPLGQKPRDLAVIVQTALAARPEIKKAEIAGPGFVNLTLAESALEGLLAEYASGLGIERRHAGQSVVIDYSSPNVAKPMHVAHIRSTIIGDALCRVLKAVGYRVVADNHLGDWGTQFGKLIVAYRLWLDKDAYQRGPIAELVRLYQKFVGEEKKQAQELGIKKPDRGADAAAGKDKSDKGDDADEGQDEAEAEAGTLATPLLQAARAELVKLQKGDPENYALWREFVSVSMAEFERTYARLGIRFDTMYGESHYNPRLASLVEELLARGIAEPSRGAVICPVEGSPAPLLIRKADGSFLYGTTDLATIELRVREYQPSRILYVVGAPQQLHFQQVFAVAKKMGVTASLEHLPFGTMRFKDAEGKWSTGSTRQGNVPLLEEFLDEATRRAEAVAREKNPDLSEAELAEVARVVGIGAIKYNDLCHDRQADIHFEVDKATALDGNTAPYIQYAYARLRSILRKGAEAQALPGESVRIGAASERALVRRLLDYPAVIEQVAERTRPHILCEYLFELAGAVSTFYNELPVLKAAPEERASRLRLLELAAQTLQHGLSLLGIEVPERM